MPQIHGLYEAAVKKVLPTSHKGTQLITNEEAEFLDLRNLFLKMQEIKAPSLAFHPHASIAKILNADSPHMMTIEHVI